MVSSRYCSGIIQFRARSGVIGIEGDILFDIELSVGLFKDLIRNMRSLSCHYNVSLKLVKAKANFYLPKISLIHCTDS